MTASSPATNSDKPVPLPFESFPGSTGLFFRLQPGTILKSPVTVGFDNVIRPRVNIEYRYTAEEKILNWLGSHPRIIRYLGSRTTFPTGLLFAEARHGNLQSFLHQHNANINASLRQKWFLQAIEAVVFIHSKNVLHADLRPENFLIYDDMCPNSLDLCLCDFGGSTCEDLNISGNSLPDSGFFDPNAPWKATPAIDIFSLGSVLYAIMTGHWPFRTTTGIFESGQEKDEYEAEVDRRFCLGDFPKVDGLFGGDIILGCWKYRFSHATEILACALELTIER
ncbi:hypothetical protein E4U21_000713 [Claviceps maximensis]|nr:hypothetical protein E4U21_000713 [Claviceps maximensis]